MERQAPTPAIVATDMVLFTLHPTRGLLVRTIVVTIPGIYDRRRALPGGLILTHETAEESVMRNLDAKTGISSLQYMEQLAAMSALQRDPRSRVVAIAFMGLASWRETWETDANWLPIKDTPSLAYDHDEILSLGLRRLRDKITYSTLVRHLLPASFTLTHLLYAYETILGRTLDKRNFRKKFLDEGLVRGTGKKESGKKNRPAELFVWSAKRIVFRDLV